MAKFERYFTPFIPAISTVVVIGVGELITHHKPRPLVWWVLLGWVIFGVFLVLVGKILDLKEELRRAKSYQSMYTTHMRFYHGEELEWQTKPII